MNKIHLLKCTSMCVCLLFPNCVWVCLFVAFCNIFVSILFISTISYSNLFLYFFAFVIFVFFLLYLFYGISCNNNKNTTNIFFAFFFIFYFSNMCFVVFPFTLRFHTIFLCFYTNTFTHFLYFFWLTNTIAWFCGKTLVQSVK